jgi:hypothetical protein
VRLSSGAKDPTAMTVALFVVLPTICVFVATLAHETTFRTHIVSSEHGASTATTDAPTSVETAAKSPAASLRGAKVERPAVGNHPKLWTRVIAAVGLIAGLISFVASQLESGQKATERAQQQEARVQERLHREMDGLQKIGPLVISRTPDGKAAIVPKLLPQLLGRWRLAGEAKRGLEFRRAGAVLQFGNGTPTEGSYRFIQGDTITCTWPTSNGDSADETWRIRLTAENGLEITVVETMEVRTYLRDNDGP